VSRLRGEIVSVDIAPADLTLELVLANGVCLIAHPATTVLGEEPLWKVFLPNHRMITAGQSGVTRGRSDE
jgi:hypothetical protein